ncbi:MAG: CRISPR-associated endonuclease Cas1 [Betaproteobacteria bacterium]|nr:CRISPR-associated endonuclease Cas1 [Betaproteobacteria bacterium]
MGEQRELPLSFPELSAEAPQIPARMLNEYVYCPRLAYLEWVQGEFAHSADTIEGAIKHKRVDKKGGALPEEPEEGEMIHARSVSLSSTRLGITAKLDLVEGEGSYVTPVDYKRGSRPHVAAGAYDPERVQLCAQGLLLQEHGFECDSGIIYFASSRERVRVLFDDALTEKTLAAIHGLRGVALAGHIPPPLEDSPKCPRCSLVGICQPDEVRFLNRAPVEPRPLFPALQDALPLYVQSPRAYVRKDGDVLVIEVEKEKVAEARLVEVSQVALFGGAMLSAPALHECFRRNIPVTWHTYSGWFVGHTVGTGHHNVETRTFQYQASFDPQKCLRLARGWVAAKIANCRTMLRRNWRGGNGFETEDAPEPEDLPGARGGEVATGQGAEQAPREILMSLREDAAHAQRALSLDELLGVEGAAANRYFQNFGAMLKSDADPSMSFDFMGRNRRPPKDPINALLSFAYAMLAREWTITVSAVGLDPYRGFYHQPRFGRPALSLDLMEPFRPLVADSAVLMAVNNGEVRPTDFVRAAGSCNLTESGRRRFIAAFERRMQQEVMHSIFRYRISYRRLLEVQARLLIRYLAGEIEDYPNFVTR